MPSPEELIRAGGATLAFDTNAILGFLPTDHRIAFGAFLNLCDDANRLRDELSPRLQISIIVPSLVHMEVLHDLRVDLGEKPFDETRPHPVFRDKKAEVVSFTEQAAMKASGALHRWFGSGEAWSNAKRERCLEILGLKSAEAPGKSGLASIDWAIAAQAEAAGWILVTADAGAEFRNVSLKIKKIELRKLFDDLLRERNSE